MDVVVEDVNVSFPFKPYNCQTDYMQKVIVALKNGENALLESPTGTGKTLSLLCSSLAWQETAIANRQGIIKQQEALGSLAGTGELTNAQKDWFDQLAASAGVIDPTSTGTPKIIFSSRTHSQLSQAMQELKRTAYNTRRAGIIGSRDQLCIHPDVQKLDNNQAKMQQCKIKVQTHTCEFYNRYEQMKPEYSNKETGPLPASMKPMNVMRQEHLGTANILDIEELVTAGEKKKFCPYYMSRELQQDAEIIFMPYNYLLDSKIRQLHSLEIEGNVLIFDEAHNIEKVCEDSGSIQLTSTEIARCAEELAEVIRKIIKHAEEVAEMEEKEDEIDGDKISAMALAGQLEFDAGQVVSLQKQVQKLEETLEELPVPPSNSELSGLTKPGEYIYEFLDKCGLSFSNCRVTIELIQKIVKFNSLLSSDPGGGKSSAAWKVASGSGSLSTGGITKLAEFLKTVFSAAPAAGQEFDPETVIHVTNVAKRAAAKEFKMHIQEVNMWTSGNKQTSAWDAPRANAVSKRPTQRVINYWCFAPSLAMKTLIAEKPRSVILTSGTLYPMETFKLNLDIPFPWTLQNPHVIQKNQVWVGALTKGPDGMKLNSSYQYRDTREYKNSLGQTIANFARQIPHGMLVFFPSYAVMASCLEFWRGSDLFYRIVQQKPILEEPKKKSEFQETIDNYYKTVCNPDGKGCLLVAVCRGKVSEGLDFADHFGRAVLITGLPFPPFLDPWVKLKMEHMDERRVHLGQGITGKQWYRQEAWRAVNQAVGRVIRHCNDYGALLLCDERFSNSEAAAQLPAWLRTQLHTPENFGVALREVSQFFRTASELYPTPSGPVIRRKEVKSNAASAFQFQTRNDTNQISAAVMDASEVELHTRGIRRKHRADAAARRAAAEVADTEAVNSYCPPPGALAASTSSDSGSRSSLLTLLRKHEKIGGADADADSPMARTLKRKHDDEDKKLLQKMKSDADSAMKRLKVQMVEFKPVSEVTVDNFASSGRSEKFRQFRSEAKVQLTTEQYERFNKVILEYKNKKPVEEVVEQLALCFLPHACQLFSELFVVIRTADKQYFREVCLERAGIDPGALVENTPPPAPPPPPQQTEPGPSTSSASKSAPPTGEPAPVPQNCPQCNQDFTVILFARECRHRACMKCWRKVMVGDRRCPTCKKVLRKRDLVKVV